MGWPLRYFKGETQSYVFSDGEHIHDYEDVYSDNDSFCELMATFVKDATGSEEYAEKMLRVLANKLGIENHLLKTPRTWDKCEQLMHVKCDKLARSRIKCPSCSSKDKRYKRLKK